VDWRNRLTMIDVLTSPCNNRDGTGRRMGDASHINFDSRLSPLPVPTVAAPDGRLSKLESEMVEEWRVVPGYPKYEVSSLGRVRSWYKPIWRAGNPPYILAGGYHQRDATQEKGRRVVLLYETSRKCRSFEVARLVLLAFSRSPNPGEQVRHLDGNASNDNIENLAWGTAKENTADKIGHGRWPAGENNGNVKLTEDDVLAIRASKERHAVMVERYGVCYETISQIRRRIIWRHI